MYDYITITKSMYLKHHNIQSNMHNMHYKSIYIIKMVIPLNLNLVKYYTDQITIHRHDK